MVEYHKNVVRFDTREPLEASYSAAPNPYIGTIVNMLSQRQAQIQDMVVIFVEKGDSYSTKMAANPMTDERLCWFAIMATQYAMRDSDDEFDIDTDEEDRP
jgi:hypothetical protein